MRFARLLLSGLALCSSLTAAPAAGQTTPAAPWVPDNGDGTYRNPVIFADYSDPDVVRVGDDFYMVASSFQHAPGLPILHSRDLVNWTIVGHAAQRLPSPTYDTPQHGQGASGRRRSVITRGTSGSTSATRTSASS